MVLICGDNKLMDNFFSVLVDKVEDALFEILGLLLPSLTLCVVLVEPIFYTQSFPLRSIPKDEFTELLEILNEFWPIVFIFFVFYVVGNAIKVAAKLYYDLGKALFDNTLFVFIVYIFDFIIGGAEKIQAKWNKQNEQNKKNKQNEQNEQNEQNKLKEMPVVVIVNELFTWIKKTLSFSTVNYDKIFEDTYIDLAMHELYIFDREQEKSDKWFLFYKEATTIFKQKKIDTLCYKFLAKYNSFRSLEFVFAVGIIYNILILFTQMAIDKYIFFIVLGVNIVCWVSFHEKYKRYWKLCGDEAIVGLDYFYRFEKGSKESE